MTTLQQLIEREAHTVAVQMEEIGYIHPLHSPTLESKIIFAINNVINRMPKKEEKTNDNQ